MHLMREAEVPQTSRDRLFRTSRLYAMLWVLGCLGVCAAMILRRWPTQRLSYVFSAIVLLILFLLHRFVTARFHPSNWLLRMSDEGLFVHFRSYLNEDMPAEDATVVFLSYSDLRSARLIRERLETRDLQGERQTQYLRWVEFELAVGPDPLAAALSTELARPALSKSHWYGRSATLYRDYPLRMQMPPFLRVRWQAVPGPRTFLDALSVRVNILPQLSSTEDFTELQGLTREQQTARVRNLQSRGDVIAAVYLARRFFGYDLTQASNYVKSLQGETRP